MSDQLQIWIDDWVYRYFAPEIESYCDILLNRLIPIFEDLDGEGKKAASEFLGSVRAHSDTDYHEVLEAAYEHAQEHVMQFMEMRSVFLAAGVSGLFHLFERQLYKHINKELDRWLTSPIADWRTLEDIILKFDRKYGEDKPCSDLLDAFRDSDLLELRLVANTVKHGDNGQSHKQLVARKARVVEPERLANDFTVGPYSILKVIYPCTLMTWSATVTPFCASGLSTAHFAPTGRHSASPRSYGLPGQSGLLRPLHGLAMTAPKPKNLHLPAPHAKPRPVPRDWR